MEENPNLPEEPRNEEAHPTEQAGLIIDTDISAFLMETAKWAKLVAVIIFIMAGFIALLGVFITIGGTVGSFKMVPFMGGFLGIVYIALSLLYYFPAKYLYDFTTFVKQALYFRDQESLGYAFGRLKSHYKFIGIMAVVAIIFYVVAILFAILFGMLGAMRF
ncbi:hypothetical protein Pedsa_2091 [Pseudopedobacter saltans DSM 12145]|uniref:DUF5362 domain-containing protein n=1 Tax=Pseudopedobacter saltans (strain ATCC 51119 / DSM 12145 / JCM 21818 / CCUG 39354 / LMG 10337 / NBRC 100064 / NCIMB 13643) TaxID=762903 RepID=F0SB08_PSESL|nr:DUF5362 family protein [Pseudopedobacter saltans]ADY52643.1 hypothetical protein Pedsa_2091 [Pseudopedobacter saltans DSM 12145]